MIGLICTSSLNILTCHAQNACILQTMMMAVGHPSQKHRFILLALCTKAGLVVQRPLTCLHQRNSRRPATSQSADCGPGKGISAAASTSVLAPCVIHAKATQTKQVWTLGNETEIMSGNHSTRKARVKKTQPNSARSAFSKLLVVKEGPCGSYHTAATNIVGLTQCGS